MARPTGTRPRYSRAAGRGSELVGRFDGLDDRELGWTLDARRLHQARDRRVVLEEVLERRGVGPLVDDHDEAVAEPPPMMQRSRGFGFLLHRLELRRVVDPHLLHGGG